MKIYTVAGKQDGFGAQYQAVMSGIAYCEYMNYKYVHTPFVKMAHCPDANRMNEFIGMPTKNDSNINFDIQEQYSLIVHRSKTPDIYYSENVKNTIRKHYYSTAKPIISNFDIAIHIRKGDVSSANKKRFTDNNIYRRIIFMLKNKYPQYSICIYSEGNLDDFEQLFSQNVYFCLNETIEKTFHSLVRAKVLVTAKSSLSYSAALLNTNTIYYLPFWHHPLKDWIVIYG